MKSIAFLFVIAGVGVFALKSKMLPEYLDHECARQCEDGGAPKECRYKFVVETYQTLSKACYGCASGNFTDCLRPHCITADGNVRNVLSVNRMVPGPTIQVCEGDTVIVDVETFMAMSEGIGIHWHGILQKAAQHMDGVPMITQCPINSGTFQYRFHIIDEGTHLWHAHAGVQRGDGMFGSFVVRQPPSLEPHYSLYDFDLPEHVMVLNEWTPEPMDEVITISNMGNGQTSGVSSILINGRAADVTGSLTLPRAVFEVKAGFRYRFRLISAGSLFCPLRVSIDDHPLLLIATDGRPFVPFEVGSFDMLSAERYDFVLNAAQDNGSFWLRVAGQGQCSGKEGRAVIQYVKQDDPDVTSGDREEPEDGPAPEIKGKKLIYWDIPSRPVPTEPEVLNVTNSREQLLAMDALAKDDDALQKKPDRQFFLELNMNLVNNLHLFDPDLYPVGSVRAVVSPQINGITNKLGPVPLLSQRDEVPPGQICNSSALGDNCIDGWCECSHLLSVNVHEIVELVITNPTRTNASTFIHPFHAHGFSFRVVAMDKLDEPMNPALFQELDEKGLILRKLHLAPFKDTVALPEGGFIVIRFKADNPGVWFMHCHLLFHAELGMAVAMEVLDENGGLPPPPPGFPRCGPFALPDDDDENSSVERTGNSGVDSASGAKTQGTYGSGANLRGSASEVQTATPSWVLPVILGLSAAVAGLASFSVVLWRRNKRNKPDVWVSYPSYTSDGHSGCDPNDTVETFFAPSRKQERIGLTK